MGAVVVWEPQARLDHPGVATTRIEGVEVQVVPPGEPQMEVSVQELENSTLQSSWIWILEP